MINKFHQNNCTDHKQLHLKHHNRYLKNISVAETKTYFTTESLEMENGIIMDKISSSNVRKGHA